MDQTLGPPKAAITGWEPARWPHWVLLGGALLLASMAPNRLWDPLYFLLLAGPLVGAFLRDRPVFLLWTTYVLCFIAFVHIRTVADDLGAGPYALYVIRWDQILGLGHVPPVFLQQSGYTPGSPRWWDYAALGVHLTYYVAVPVGGFLVWRFRRADLAPYLLGMGAAYVAGAFVHMAIPTVPPWLASIQGHLPELSRPLFELWHGISPAVYKYGDGVAGGNDVAAMPSMHAGAAALIGRAAWETRWRWAGVAYPILMTTALVYMAEHYIVDAIAGSALVIACWAAVRRGMALS